MILHRLYVCPNCRVEVGATHAEQVDHSHICLTSMMELSIYSVADLH